MDHERAEIYLRLLTETELRRACVLFGDGSPGSGPDRRRSATLRWVAQALSAVHAVSTDIADEIRGDLELAIAVRNPGQLGVTGPGSGSRTGGRQATWPRSSWRLVPVGHVIGIHADDWRGQLCLLSYAQTAEHAWFTMSGWIDGWIDGLPTIYGPRPGPPSPSGASVSPHTSVPSFTAVDDAGTTYQLRFRGGRSMAQWKGALDLRPHPAREIRWLDLTTGVGEAATRVELAPHDPPQVTVTPTVISPGEHVLTGIAARLLALEPARQATGPRATASQAAGGPGPLTGIADGLGEVVAGLRAAGVLSPSSPLPGQLTVLCAALGIGTCGITDPPADELPELWRNILARHCRGPRRGTLGGWAVLAVELPELDGARIALLGLRLGEDGTIAHLHATGVTPEVDGPRQLRSVRPMPVMWLRDNHGRWHTTRLNGLTSRANGEAMLQLAVVPPLDRDTAWIEVVAVGQSAQARVTLPLRWI